MSKSKKQSRKDAAQELLDARFRDYLNHQSELRNLYAEQEANERRRAHITQAKERRRAHIAEAIEQRRKAKFLKAVERERTAKKWSQVRTSAIVAFVSWAIFHAQTAGLIAPRLAMPLVTIGLAYAVYKLCGVLKVCITEEKE